MEEIESVVRQRERYKRLKNCNENEGSNTIEDRNCPKTYIEISEMFVVVKGISNNEVVWDLKADIYAGIGRVSAQEEGGDR